MNPATPDSPRPEILVVDDDPDIRDVVSEVLSDAGYQTAAVENGDQALQWLERHGSRTSLVLLDMMMPVMDGREFLRQKAHADPALSALPVVVITAGGGCEDLLQTHVVAACLDKPISADDLLAVVDSCQRSPDGPEIALAE